MASETDETLMERFCQGDEAAFDALFQRHAPGIQAFVGRMVSDPAMAEDLVQSTFLSVIRSRGRYERGMNVGSWILTIAANAARDVLRRRRKNIEQLSEDGVSKLDSPVFPRVSDPGARKRIEAAFEALPEGQREAVILHKLQGWSFEQIADSLEISPTAARIRAHRGYEKLRESLGDLGRELEVA